tara:strand:+ start:2103 stop:2735 length:633 start_codon:yes stop_codon:yes gene_type:complete
MKASEIVESIKEVLGMELAEVKVQFEERELDNGTKIEADKFEEGASVFIVSESGDEKEKIALPVGNYEINDGTVLVVTEEGKIGELREASDEVPQKEEAKEEKEEMKEEEEMDEEADVADWKGMEKRIKNLEDAIADLKSDKQDRNSKEEEMYSKEKVEAAKVELNEVEVSAEPISHNPEKIEKKERVHLAKGKAKNTLDRVLEKLNNHK